MKTIEKDYVVNEAVLTMFHTIHAIYHNFNVMFPKRIRKQILKLMDILINDLEKGEDYDRDYVDYEIIKRITYKDDDKTYKLK